MKKIVRGIVRGLGLEGYRSNRIFMAELLRLDPTVRVENRCLLSCGLRIRLAEDRWLLGAVPWLIDLKNSCGFSFRLDGGVLHATKGETCFKLVSLQEVGIIWEVYARGVYRLLTSGELFIVDVGANIGVSTVYCATELSAEVVGFELVPAVAARAVAHVNRNKLQDRVKIIQGGLGAVDGSATVVFSPDLTGSTSLHSALSADKVGDTVECPIIGIEVLRDILGASPREKYMKLDCEGAEYEILEALAKTGLLQEFLGFMVEYHEISAVHDRSWLEKFFVNHGFSLLAFSRPNSNHEMMYAFRQ